MPRAVLNNEWRRTRTVEIWITHSYSTGRTTVRRLSSNFCCDWNAMRWISMQAAWLPREGWSVSEVEKAVAYGEWFCLLFENCLYSGRVRCFWIIHYSISHLERELVNFQKELQKDIQKEIHGIMQQLFWKNAEERNPWNNFQRELL